jgi:hypothetical protein
MIFRSPTRNLDHINGDLRQNMAIKKCDKCGNSQLYFGKHTPVCKKMAMTAVRIVDIPDPDITVGKTVYHLCTMVMKNVC